MEKSWSSQIYYSGNFKNTLRLLKNMQLEPVNNDVPLYTKLPPLFPILYLPEKKLMQTKYGWLLKTD